MNSFPCFDIRILVIHLLGLGVVALVGCCDVQAAEGGGVEGAWCVDGARWMVGSSKRYENLLDPKDTKTFYIEKIQKPFGSKIKIRKTFGSKRYENLFGSKRFGGKRILNLNEGSDSRC